LLLGGHWEFADFIKIRFDSIPGFSRHWLYFFPQLAYLERPGISPGQTLEIHVSNKNNATKPASATAPTPTESVPTDPPVTGEIVPAPDSSLSVPGNTLEYLAKDLPHLREKLSKMVVPTAKELESAVQLLSTEERSAFDAFWAAMTEVPEGMGEGSEESLTKRMREIKLFQGSGDDPGRPEDCPNGGFYVKGGRTLAVLSDDSQRLELPNFFRAAVLGLYNGRIYWPQKDRAGNVQLPPGLDASHKGPICQSLDGQKGTFYGACKTCPFRPSQTAGEKACVEERHLYLMLENFQIYKVILRSTSIPGCATPIRAQVDPANGWRFMWECFFSFSSEKRQSPDGSRRWYVWKAQVAKSKTFPQGMATSAGFRKVSHYFSRLISTEWYYPDLAVLYSKAGNPQNTSEGRTASNDDALAALKASTETVDERNNI
jgi:hypothetical protein